MNFAAKILTGMCKALLCVYVVMTYNTAKAKLEKGFSWPSEAIPYGVLQIGTLVIPQWSNPTSWTRPAIPAIRLLDNDISLVLAEDASQ